MLFFGRLQWKCNDRWERREQDKQIWRQNGLSSLQYKELHRKRTEEFIRKIHVNQEDPSLIPKAEGKFEFNSNENQDLRRELFKKYYMGKGKGEFILNYQCDAVECY